MSEIRVNSIVSETGSGNVAFNKGITVTGVTTSTSFKGDIVGDVTGDVTGNVTGNCSGTSGSATGTAGGLSGTPDITVQNITGVAATFTGAVTYEDVTNVDSIGIVTARGGLKIGAAGVGGTITTQGNAIFVGVTTVGTGLTLADDVQARFGNSGELKIYNGTYSYINDSSGRQYLKSDRFYIQSSAGENLIYAEGDANVILYHDNSQKLATSATGVTVTGNATATQFIGVSTGGTASGATVGVGTTATILGVTDGATQNRFSGILVEKCAIQATNVTSSNVDLAKGNVHYFTSNGSGATTADIIYKGGNNLSSYMKVGENVSISIISKPNNSEYISALTIDGAAVTEEWAGGTPSSASGAASTWTITTINLTRIAATGTPNSDYLCLCQATNFE